MGERYEARCLREAWLYRQWVGLIMTRSATIQWARAPANWAESLFDLRPALPRTACPFRILTHPSYGTLSSIKGRSQ